jgi:hypothetical protein
VLILFVFPVLAVLATLWGVYYSRQQLKEAKRIREENHKLFDDQRREDNAWSGKCARASQALCALAPRFIQGSAGQPSGYALSILFPDPSLRTRVLSHLIEHKGGLDYIARPLDVSQLRLNPLRELIDLVLSRFEEFKAKDPDIAKRMGL